MFFDDINVPIPERKRITKYEKTHSKPYVYEILVRKGKDNPKDVVACVGVVSEDGKMHPNERYFELHPECEALKPEEKETRIFDDQIHLGASAVLRKISDDLGISRTVEESFPGCKELVQTLLEYYMIERDSTSQLYKYYLYDHFTSLNFIPGEKMLSALFRNHLTHENIKKFLEKWMKRKLLNSTEAVEIDFDSTNFNIGSHNIESAERGKAKDDEGLPQINVAYFLDHRTGLPIYYDIYYGSIIDMEHCKTAIAKLKTIKPDIKASFVMDRGYFSESNLSYLENNNYDYLCMGKQTKEFKKLVTLHSAVKISRAVNRIYGTVYGIKERGKVFSESEKEYYKYFFYDTSKASTELPEIQDSLEYISSCLIGKRDKKQYIRNTYGRKIDITVDGNDVITDAVPNYQYIDSIRDTCGFFWIISNMDMTPEEALESYRHRDVIEKTFRNIKTESDFNKVYAESDAAFESKSVMAFMTAAIRAELSMKLKPYFFQYSSETTQTVLKELDKIKAEQIGKKYYMRYPLTSRQKQILSFFELSKNDIQDYINSINETILLNDETDS